MVAERDFSDFSEWSVGLVRVKTQWIWYFAAACQAAHAQSGGSPATITLKDALERAQKIAPQVLSAAADVNAAHQDLIQAKSGQLPSASFRSEYLGTQGNGVLPSGRFVTNDGVHVYRDWGVVHQDFTAAATRTAAERASLAESLAKARAEVARRGLSLTVTKAYYALLSSQRKYATAQQSLDDARRYLEITQKLQRGGEVARQDTVRAELQTNAQEQAFREAKLAMDQARMDLSVLLFPDFNQNFTVVDDLTPASPLPELGEVQAMAARENPEVRVAMSTVDVARSDVKIARQGYLPSLTADFAYGLEANAFALHSTVAANPEVGKLPNLGYFLTVSLNVPVWDWGARKSRVKTAEIRRDQANVDLSATQRALLRNLNGAYQEAQTAREQLAALQRAVDLSAENLRLVLLRYQAAEATILELVDAQTSQIQSRNAYEDGLVRYRLALANLQTLTGTF